MIVVANGSRFIIGDSWDIEPEMAYEKLWNLDVWYDDEHEMIKAGETVLFYRLEKLEYIITKDIIIVLEELTPAVFISH